MDISTTLSVIIFIIMIILLYFVYGTIKWVISITIVGLVVYFIYTIIKKITSHFSNTYKFNNNYKIKKINDFIYEIDDFIDSDKCKELINKYDKNLEKSFVISNEKISNDRTSNQKWISQNQEYELNNKILNLVNEFSKSKLTINHLEDFQFTKYNPSQEYKGHYDVCDIKKDVENSTECKLDYENIGSYRYITVILYLNDDFQGGETYFNKLNIKIKPKIGKALLFINCILDSDSFDSGKCDRIENSMHSGLSVKSGNKYILTKWVRLKEIT